MFREEFSEQGEAEDQNIAFWKVDYVVFLLGSGFPPEALEFRKKTGKALNDRGYNIIVKEELDGAPTEGDSKELANEKFRRILKNHRPNLFLILVSQSLPAASGVTYEIATLVERYGIKKASSMIRMCVKKGVVMNHVYPTYVRELKEIVIREYDGDFDDMLSVLENTIIDSMTRAHRKP
jgi:hypothetical protein